jgi:AcrR family transcriptional regulator
MRRVADSIGVSATAVYRHFPDREGLLRGAATQAIDELVADLESTMSQEHSARMRLEALLTDYLEAAATAPGRFRLMFGPLGAGHVGGFLDADPLGPKPQRLFVAVAHELIETRPDTAADATTLATMLWATVRGLATLMLDGPLEPSLARTLAIRLAASPPLI